MSTNKSSVMAGILALALLVGGSGARADMSARDIVFADVDAMQSLVIEYFGACQASQFAAALAQAHTGECMRPSPPGYRCLGDDSRLFFNLARLIQEAGRIRRENIAEFLERINQGKLLRGHLLARYGGDYETTLTLDIEPDTGRHYLTAQHHFRDGRKATWRYPITPQ